VNTDKYVFVGWPLGIDGATPFSIGFTVGYGCGAAFEEFISEFDDTESFRRSIELKLGTVSVIIAQTLEGVRKSCCPECIPYQVNRRNMLFQSIRSVAVQERNGVDVAEAWRILDTYVASQPEDIKRAAVTLKRRSKVDSMLRSAVARVIHRFPGWEYLAHLRGGHIFHGRRHHFQNMEQCGQVAPQLIARVAGLGGFRCPS
jgi:hypothetical protein